MKKLLMVLSVATVLAACGDSSTTDSTTTTDSLSVSAPNSMMNSEPATDTTTGMSGMSADTSKMMSSDTSMAK